MLKSNKSVITFPHSVNIYSLTFQQLIELNEKIEIPDVQVDLNEDKVCQMIESYNKNPKFFGQMKTSFHLARLIFFGKN
jgi:hypothetical protein